jgi:SAM-dependent methyltransferase
MDNSKYYEAFDWDGFTDATENFKTLLRLIPNDVKSILDVGCGNGLITNPLGESGFEVTGVDRSVAALKNVTTAKIQCDCNAIPVEDLSFDLVLSSELLEHLEPQLYAETVAEMKRIAKKYILVSVPNDESLSKGIIECPECKTRFHRCYHMHTFTPERLVKDFSGFKLVETLTFGLKVRLYNESLARMKQKVSKPENWIPHYRTKNESRKAFCPKCEHEFVYPYKFNLLASGLDALNILVTKKKPFHLVVLLERVDA